MILKNAATITPYFFILRSYDYYNTETEKQIAYFKMVITNKITVHKRSPVVQRHWITKISYSIFFNQ